MDGGKGVMMSERPSGGGGGGGGGGGDAGVSIGNYKGVMLCNRPFAGATAGAHAGGAGGSTSGEARPFVTGIDKEKIHPRGWDPSKRERKNTVPERNYKNTALSKHKQWLRKLQQQRTVALEQAAEEEERKAARHDAFLATQQRMRDVVRGLATADVVDTQMLSASVPAGPSFNPNQQERALQSSILSAAQQKKLKGGQRPAWAYTAEAKEKAEEDEADELLRFAESLDFDAYLDDLEVRTAMEQAKAQLEALEQERVADVHMAAAAARAAAAEERQAQAQASGEHQPGGKVTALTADSLRQFDETQGDSKEQYGGGGRAVDAASVMSNVSAAESIRSVHSKRSLQAVINREKSRMAPTGGLPIISESGAASAQALPQPRIVTHDDTGGSRITKKDLISQLPYMNRNPAV